ncbi:hypothetical protein K437DRAFT_171962 [Tilletiaria anomala UBC 951]|uniref:Zn(2)-C6 fungal-type domain-containing protein n=1 Tax=Tilletiaria anomala (strain ATCC 24038 / CBS 436.72 / UBC 951) TaxID=1037660 RepID=A0A066VJD2_TILAU|nr:uncharacterized protein K437DRAFT_171962 [Tilletiaria anomala UBC 951]KDN41606.1 hypothetical protein K437DRAFT_171962 [Tilletiaria anomala UBC 951]
MSQPPLISQPPLAHPSVLSHQPPSALSESHRASFSSGSGAGVDAGHMSDPVTHSRLRSMSAAAFPSHAGIYAFQHSAASHSASESVRESSVGSSASVTPAQPQRQRASSNKLIRSGTILDFSPTMGALLPLSRSIGSSGVGTTRRAKFKRSRTGCLVCRKRKVKCSQDGTPCKQCRIGDRACFYEAVPTPRKRSSRLCAGADHAASVDQAVSVGDEELDELDDESCSQVEDVCTTEPGSGLPEQLKGGSGIILGERNAIWNSRGAALTQGAALPPPSSSWKGNHPVASGVPGELFNETSDFDSHHLLSSMNAAEELYQEPLINQAPSRLGDSIRELPDYGR